MYSAGRWISCSPPLPDLRGSRLDDWFSQGRAWENTVAPELTAAVFIGMKKPYKWKNLLAIGNPPEHTTVIDFLDRFWIPTTKLRDRTVKSA